VINVFADSNYWVATINERDRYYSAAQVARASLGDVILVTTDEILVEVLNYFADKGEHLRRFASESVARVQENPNVEVLPQTRESLRKGFPGFNFQVQLSRVSSWRRILRTGCGSQVSSSAGD